MHWHGVECFDPKGRSLRNKPISLLLFTHPNCIGISVAHTWGIDDMLENLTRQHWMEVLDQPFQVLLEGMDMIPLKLVQISSLGNSGAMRGEAYSLEFLGPRLPILPQRIYGLRNENMGELEIFLVPIGANQEGVRYEAIFT